MSTSIHHRESEPAAKRYARTLRSPARQNESLLVLYANVNRSAHSVESRLSAIADIWLTKHPWSPERELDGLIEAPGSRRMTGTARVCFRADLSEAGCDEQPKRAGEQRRATRLLSSRARCPPDDPRPFDREYFAVCPSCTFVEKRFGPNTTTINPAARMLSRLVPRASVAAAVSISPAQTSPSRRATSSYRSGKLVAPTTRGDLRRRQWRSGSKLDRSPSDDVGTVVVAAGPVAHRLAMSFRVAMESQQHEDNKPGAADGLPTIEWSQVETQLADLLTHDDPRSRTARRSG